MYSPKNLNLIYLHHFSWSDERLWEYAFVGAIEMYILIWFDFDTFLLVINCTNPHNGVWSGLRGLLINNVRL